MKQVKIDGFSPRAPMGFWKDLAKKLIDLPPGMGLSITNDDFPHNGFTNYRTALFNPLAKQGKALKSVQVKKHELLLWVENR